MPDIFLSYNREDQTTARRFAEGFERAGFNAWWDVTLKSGQAYDRVTETALREAKAVVVLWSPRSANSDWVRAEATIGLRNKTLMPVMIEDCVRPVMFELTQTAELSHWKGDDKDPAWQNFVAELRHHIAHGSGTAMHKPAGTMTSTMTSTTATKRAERNNAVLFGTVGLAAAVVLGAGYWFTRAPTVADATSAPVSVAPDLAPPATTLATTGADTSAPVIANETIAVLPFANLSPDANDAFFASGLHDEVINQLTKITKLKVISRQSVLRFADSTLSSADIGKELHAAHIMIGTVRFANNRIRVTAQLVNAQSDENLWSESFDIDFADIFEAESQIAMNVANAMRVSFTDEERANLAKIPTQSPAAYALYLQAVSLRNQAAFGGIAAIDKMQQLLDQAITLDPGFALAYRDKGQSYAENQQIALARDYLTKASTLDPTLTSAEFFEVRLLANELKFAEALPLANELIRKYPNNSLAMELAYEAHTGTNDLIGALQYAQRLLELDKSAGSYNALAQAFSRLGRNEEAIPHWLKAVELAPAGVTYQIELAYSLAAVGRTADAVPWITRVKDTVMGPNEDIDAGGSLFSALIYANALAGRTDEAQRLFARFQQQAEVTSDLPTRARAYVSVGEFGQALALMQQMVTDKSVTNRNSVNAVRFLKLNPHHLPALERPEFVEVRRQL